MKLSRQLKFAASTAYETREETYDGRPHLVVPVVALVEGVLHAMNSATPELVTAEEFTKPSVVGGFNGRPLFEGHPVVDGEPVPGNSPDLLDELCIGRVFNAAVKKNKLTMEAWIDIAKAEKVAPKLLARVREKKAIEISVGVFCDSDPDDVGEYDGHKYAGSWHDIVPDHLALLTAEDTGACSVEMGCGVRAAKGADVKQEEKKRSPLTRLLSIFRGTQAAEEMSDNDLKGKLYQALRKTRSDVNYVEAFVPVTSPTRVIYSCYMQSTAIGPEMCMGYQSVLLERSFTLDDNGLVVLGDDEVEVEPVLSYEPMVKVAAVPKVAAQGAPCSCQHQDTRSATEMTKETLVKSLETATPEQIKALGAVTEATPASPATKVETPVAPAAAVVETKAVVETPAAPVVASKAPTFDEMLAAAEPSVRDSINEGRRMANERRTQTITALKATGRCEMTDEVLASKSQPELDQLMKLAGAPKIDFSVAGASRAQETGNEIPAAPDLTAAIRTAREGVKK